MVHQAVFLVSSDGLLCVFQKKSFARFGLLPWKSSSRPFPLPEVGFPLPFHGLLVDFAHRLDLECVLQQPPNPTCLFTLPQRTVLACQYPCFPSSLRVRDASISTTYGIEVSHPQWVWSQAVRRHLPIKRLELAPYRLQDNLEQLLGGASLPFGSAMTT